MATTKKPSRSPAKAKTMMQSFTVRLSDAEREELERSAAAAGRPSIGSEIRFRLFPPNDLDGAGRRRLPRDGQLGR